MTARTPRRLPRSPLRVLAVLVAVLTVLVGCGLVPGSGPTPRQEPSAPGPAESSPAESSSTPSRAAAPSTPESARPGRPVQPVPDVRPAGFTDPPPGTGLQRYFDQRLDWSDCDDGLQCARVLAPLDYDRPDAEALTLTLAKRPASAEPRIGSLFINPGGPGVSGVDYAGSFKVEGLERYDIVGWDPRGTGSSTPVKCVNGAAMDDYTSLDISPDDAAEQRDLEQAQLDFGLGCLERSGALLEHIATAETVRDLDLLRHLVGDRQLSYFGSSYGTRIGALYAELYPQQVGRLVLDGAVNITGRRDVTQLDGFERALSHFAAWCAGRKCKLGDTRAEVLATIGDLWRRLDAEPIRGGRDPLTQQLAVTGVQYVLYSNEQGWRFLQRALELAVFERDGRLLMLAADQYNERGRNGRYGQLQFSFPAIRCLDSTEASVTKAQREAAEEAKRAPTLGPFSGPDLVCPLWPVAPAAKPPTIRGRGAAPILVVGTTGDPATPYENAERMAEQLDSGRLLTLKGEGHLGYGQSSCIRRHVHRYLLKGDLPAEGTRC